MSAFDDAVAELHAAVDGVTRVVLCTSDGLPLEDTVGDVTAGSSAATAAAVLGIGHHSASMLGHGRFIEAVVRSTDGCLVVYGVGEARVLGVFCTAGANLTLLHRVCRRIMPALDTVAA
ncbi:MAG: roadblock/LC7 domain-containing protein [Dermatophilaceae bacterium]